MLIAALLALVAGMLWILDRRMLMKMLSIRVMPAVAELPLKLIPATIAAWIAGAFAAAGCVVLATHSSVFWPVVIIELLCLLTSVPQALLAYIRSLKHTEAHRRYLLANGATHVESIIPSVRRALRAAVLQLLWHRSSAMPLTMLVLCCGLKIDGLTIIAAIATALLIWAATIVAAAISCLIVVWLSDYSLFDKNENITSLT